MLCILIDKWTLHTLGYKSVSEFIPSLFNNDLVLQFIKKQWGNLCTKQDAINDSYYKHILKPHKEIHEEVENQQNIEVFNFEK